MSVWLEQADRRRDTRRRIHQFGPRKVFIVYVCGHAYYSADNFVSALQKNHPEFDDCRGDMRVRICQRGGNERDT
jgi:hypothetical protein